MQIAECRRTTKNYVISTTGRKNMEFEMKKKEKNNMEEVKRPPMFV